MNLDWWVIDSNYMNKKPKKMTQSWIFLPSSRIYFLWKEEILSDIQHAIERNRNIHDLSEKKCISKCKICMCSRYSSSYYIKYYMSCEDYDK